MKEKLEEAPTLVYQPKRTNQQPQVRIDGSMKSNIATKEFQHNDETQKTNQGGAKQCFGS